MPLKPEDVTSGEVASWVRPDGTKAELTFPPDMDPEVRARLIEELDGWVPEDAPLTRTLIEPTPPEGTE